MNSIIKIKVFNLEKYLGDYSKESCDNLFSIWKRWYYEHPLNTKIFVDMSINTDLAFEYSLLPDRRNAKTITQDEIIGYIESFDSRFYDDTFYANIIVYNKDEKFISSMKKMIKDDLLYLYISPYFDVIDEKSDYTYENIKDIELFKATVFPLNRKAVSTSKDGNINLRYTELVNSTINAVSYIDLPLAIYDIREYTRMGTLSHYEEYKNLLVKGTHKSDVLLPVVLCDHYTFDIFDGDNWEIMLNAYMEGALDFTSIGSNILYDPCEDILNNYISVRLFKTRYLMQYVKRILNINDQEPKLSDILENFFLIPFTLEFNDETVYDSFILRSFKESPELLNYLERYKSKQCN